MLVSVCFFIPLILLDLIDFQKVINFLTLDVVLMLKIKKICILEKRLLKK